MTEHREHMIIIGTGSAGLTAAIYAARANIKPLVIAGLQPGGQVTITTDVENYPGFAEAIQGPWLMEQMQKQAEHVGARITYDLVSSVDFSQRPFRLNMDSGDTYLADTVVIATGAQARWLGLESEKTYNGKGVSACATCDGFFYRGKKVAVVGGGNTAVEEALYLSNLCQRVTLIHRRDQLRAEKVMQDRLEKTENINIVRIMSWKKCWATTRPWVGLLVSVCNPQKMNQRKNWLWTGYLWLLVMIRQQHHSGSH